MRSRHPTIWNVGEVKAVGQYEPPGISASGFVAATQIFFGRTLRLASLDVAIEAAPKQIGAVRGIPDKVVVGDRNFAVGHGRNSSRIFAVTVMTVRRIGALIAAYCAEIILAFAANRR